MEHRGKSFRDFIGDLKTCPQCGKTFNVLYVDEWAYRRDVAVPTRKTPKPKRLIFCSWGCLRAFDKEREEEKKAKRKKILEDYEE